MSRADFNRIRRVVRESGYAGAARRGTIRLLRHAAEALARLADRAEFRPSKPPASLSAWTRDVLAANERLRGRHRGQRGFVLGTGPSLTPQLVEALAGEVVIGCNESVFALAESRRAATYGLFIDPFYFAPGQELSTLYRDLKTLASDNKISFIFDMSAHRCQSDLNCFEGCEIFYLQQIGQLSDYARAGVEPLLDLTAAVPGLCTASHAAIASALYMGLSPIYLVGHDYDFLAAPDQPVEHFYGESRYYPNVPSLVAATGSYRDFLTKVATWLQAYEALAAYAQRRGQTIVNVTPRTRLPIFERADLAAVLAAPASTAAP